MLYLTKQNHIDGSEEACFLIDRKNNYYLVPGLHFPRPGLTKEHGPDFASFHTDSILDGELLYDNYPGGNRVLKYLVFDCLVLDGQNLTNRTLDKRLAFFHEGILEPYNKLWERFRADCEQNFKFRVQKKDTQRGYGIAMMFEHVIPQLKHGSDGLIFTCRETPYIFGTDENILKWKPAEENSIDFKLDLRFPPLMDGPTSENNPGSGSGQTDEDYMKQEHDYSQQPHLRLNVLGPKSNIDQEFGTLFATPEEWERMKAWVEARDDGLDGQIVECHQDEQGRWRFNRFRDDKLEANHHTVSEKVLESIEDAVSKEDLKAAAEGIKASWKRREKERN